MCDPVPSRWFATRTAIFIRLAGGRGWPTIGEDVAGVAVIAREEEVAALEAFLDRAATGASVLVLTGEPGVGKTTLWQAGIEEARERSFRVLTASPSAAETGMSFAALGDLLGGAVDEVLPTLPSPQRRALEVALLLTEAEGSAPDQRAVAAAVFTAFRTLALSERVLVAVDDVQWLDAASAATLAYSARRLREERIGLLVAERVAEGEPLPLGLGRVATEDVSSLRVGPLTLGATHRLLRQRLGLTLPRPVLRRVHETAGGNPFYALEIARALPADGVVFGQPLPIPRSLEELVRGRVAALPPEAQEVLLVAAALSDPRVGVIEATVASGARSALRRSAEAGVIAVEGDRVRFLHPLLASAAYGLAGENERRDVHGRLAAAVAEPEERARHLALAAEGPDEAVAEELEAAAEAARWRGAIVAAADLCEQAVGMTAPDHADDVQRRRVAAGHYRMLAGDIVGARALLEEARASAPTGALRAEALALLARLYRFEGDQPHAAELARRALGQAGADVRVRAEAAQELASTLFFMREELDLALEYASLATELAGRAGLLELERLSLDMKTTLEVLLGRAGAVAAMPAPEQPRERGSPRVVASRKYYRAYVLLWIDEVEEARALLDDCLDDALAQGDESSLPLVLVAAAQAEYLAGRWQETERLASEAYEIALQVGQRAQQALSLSTRALVRASLGFEAEARRDAGEALDLTGERGMAVARIHALWALGLLELSLGRPGEAARLLGPYRQRLVAAGVAEPGSIRFLPDEIEARIALGRLDEAEPLLEWLQERGRAVDRASALAEAWRCRGLLHAARGDTPAALADFERALTEHERVAIPFERARALLALGAAQRRAKRKREARATLGEALAAFERLGAQIWAGRARDELGRISGRAPARGELTPTERRVVELVAEGLTNAEAAAALFVSPRTVEFHLRNVFRKLDVRTRAELARRFAAPVG